MTDIRDRITELRRVKASELTPNPKNWRHHPQQQSEALRAVLEDVGYADALLARETPDGLMLIDGHLRAETTPDQVVPVLVVDLDEHEADVVLATLDPLAAMASANTEGLDKLVAEVKQDGAIQQMLDSLREFKPLMLMSEPTNPEDEWGGMPEYVSEDQMSWKQLIVHFANQDDMDAFAELVGQTMTEKTQSLWYPKVERESNADKRYSADES